MGRLTATAFAVLSLGATVGCSTDPAASTSATAPTMAARGADVPNPKVTGPIPVGAHPGDKSHDYPWMALK